MLSTDSKLVYQMMRRSVLLSDISVVPPDEYLLCSDLNGHVGKASDAFNGINSGQGFGSHNADGIRIVNLCAAANLVTNMYFIKPDNHLVTYCSGNSCTQNVIVTL